MQTVVRALREILHQSGVELSEIVTIGGIPQYINVRGRDRDNPLLLFLHGGPGTPMTPIAHLFQDRWEEHFVVVHWDQRGAGKSARLTPMDQTTATMSMQRMMDDVLEMTHYLRERFGRDKIVLLGHSWGSMIGLPIAKAHPELYYAYVGTGQTIHPLRSEALGYERTLHLARKIGHREAVRQLESLAPYPTRETAYEASATRHRWNAFFGESVFGYQSLTAAIREPILTSPDYTLVDVWELLLSDGTVYAALEHDIVGYDAYRYGLDWNLPVVFLQGEYDWQVNHLLVQEYFDSITAPHKALVTIQDAAHAPMVSQADAYASALVEHVLPLVRDAQPHAE